MEQLTLGGKVWGGLFPSRERGDLVCCLLSQEQAGEIWELLPSPKPSLAAIWGMDWNRDLSPWPAQPLFGREKFTGEGEGFCQVLTQELLPLARQILGEKPTTQSLVGYSLAGLFSLWALWQTGAFTRAASLSGSLWYEGWLEFLQSRPLLHRPEKVVLTLGGKEKNTRNLRMAKVEENTLKTVQFFHQTGIPVIWEQNPGGHFHQVSQRIARGIVLLISP